MNIAPMRNNTLFAYSSRHLCCSLSFYFISWHCCRSHEWTLRGEASIQNKRLTCVVGGVIGEEPGHSVGDVFGRPDASNRMDGCHLIEHRVATKDVTQHLGSDRTRTDRIDADAERAKFNGCRFGEPDHRVLADNVDGGSRGRQRTAHRCHVDDRAAPSLLKHLSNLLLQGDKDSLDVDGEDFIEVRFGVVGDQSVLAGCSGIVERVVKASEDVYGCGNNPSYFLGDG